VPQNVFDIDVLRAVAPSEAISNNTDAASHRDRMIIGDLHPENRIVFGGIFH